MGLTYDESRSDEVTMDTRVRIKFTASGTTDGGLDWEAVSRVRTGNENRASVNAFNEIGVTISGAFGSLTFGSESSAAEYAVGDLAGVGFGPTLVGNENFFLNTNVEEARALYSYSAAGFTGYISMGQIGSDAYAVAGKYEVNGFTIALGYEDIDIADHIIGAISYTFGDTTLKATYGSADAPDTVDDTVFVIDPDTGNVIAEVTPGSPGLDAQWGVSVSHKVGAATLKGYYRTTEFNDGSDRDFYGIGADYALGGGATLAGGLASRDGDTLASLGLKFSF